MSELIPVDDTTDILPVYRDTPIARLLEYHNLDRPFDSYQSAKILVGMCMDNRAQLRIPDFFAFILRTGGVNLRYSKFHVAYAVGVGRVEAITLIAHTNCGMAGLMNRRDAFVQGMVEHAGWDEQRALDQFMNYAPMYEIDDPVDFVVDEAARMRRRYPALPIAPLLYRIEDHRLYQIADR